MEVPSTLPRLGVSRKGKSLFWYSCITWGSLEESVPWDPMCISMSPIKTEIKKEVKEHQRSSAVFFLMNVQALRIGKYILNSHNVYVKLSSFK